MKTIKILLAAFLAAGFVSCQNNQNSAAGSNADSTSMVSGTFKMAYIDVDTLMVQYQYCIDYTKDLAALSAEYKKTLDAKAYALQTAAARFQNDIQNGTITTEAEAGKKQAALQRQQETLEELQQELAVKFEEEQLKCSKALRDSLNNFLKVYNKDKRYTMIISKVGDNILYSEEALNITDEVISGLNKLYKKD